jgi:hypothetical protein
MKQYRNKENTVMAEQFSLLETWPSGVVELTPIFRQRMYSFGTKAHHVPIHPDDWIITEESGYKWVCPDYIFERIWEEVDGA